MTRLPTSSANSPGRYVDRPLGAAVQLCRRVSFMAAKNGTPVSQKRVLSIAIPGAVIATLVALVALSTGDVAAQDADRLFIAIEPELARRLPSPEITNEPGIVTRRSRLVRVDFEQLADARSRAAEQEDSVVAATLVLNLFEEEEVTVFTGVVERTNPTASGAGYVLSGPLGDVEPGRMTLLVYDDVMTGTIDTPATTYNIRPVGDGAHAITEVEFLELPPLAEPLLPPSSDAAPRESRGTRQVAASGTGAVIDVAVFYTPAAEVGAQNLTGVSGIIALVDRMIHNANVAYRNSGATQEVRLAHVQEVTYAEASTDGPCLHSPAAMCSPSSIDLQRLRGRNDGYMDDVHTLRDEYAADIVHVVGRLTGACGIAYRMRYVSRRFESDAFGLTSYFCELRDYTFAHELGHNMGLHHDRFPVKCPRVTTCDGTIDNLPYPHSHGYVNQPAFDAGATIESRWMTIMSYDEQCRLARFPVLSTGRRCLRIPAFSNPNESYLGDTLGIPGPGASQDVTGPSNAVRTLNETQWTVANFR